MKLKELSRILNLSATTVSRALNGYPEVNAETRARVLAAARRHGYAPNQMARRLATGRAMAIGYVVALHEHRTINPFFAEFMLGAGETYSARGYDLVMSIVPGDREAEAYEAMARRHKVDAVMVHTSLRHDPRIDLLEGLGMPFLMHGRADRDEAGYPWLDIDNAAAFRRATDHLLDLGHRRIGLINGLEDQQFAWRRRLGYEAALRARGIEPDPTLIRAGEMIDALGHAAVSATLDLPDPPTAYVVSAITLAMGAMRAVRERGLELGRDVSIVAHDDELSYLPNDGDPPLFTATRSSIREAGRRSAEMLIALVAAPETATRHELWDVDFVQGRSTGPLQD